MKDGIHILKLITREPAGQRQLSDPQVQQSIRSTLRIAANNCYAPPI